MRTILRVLLVASLGLVRARDARAERLGEVVAGARRAGAELVARARARLGLEREELRPGEVRYATVKLDRAYRGEEQGKKIHGDVFHTDYFSPRDRDLFEVFVVGGVLHDRFGVLDTTGSRTALRGFGAVGPDEGKDEAMFVMDRGGRIFVVPAQRVGRLHHSSILAGGEVASAGTIIVHDGIVEKVRARTGHYRPRARAFMQIQRELVRRGANLERADIRWAW